MGPGEAQRDGMWQRGKAGTGESTNFGVSCRTSSRMLVLNVHWVQAMCRGGEKDASKRRQVGSGLWMRY